MNSDKPGLLDWLCINRNFDFSKSRWLGGFFGSLLLIIVGLFALIFFVSLIRMIGALFGFGLFAADGTGAAIRNIGLLLAAVFGAPFLAWRSIVAQKQVDIAEQGLITDRINKAVQGLGAEKTVKEVVEIPQYQKEGPNWKRNKDGSLIPALTPDGHPKFEREQYEHTSPNLEVRIGAIYALERIAKDSIRDHIQIMEILCAYIRENTPAMSLDPNDPPFKRANPRTDIQIIISVIGRRSKKQIALEWEQEFRLDLRSTELSGVDFEKKDFSAAMFHFCRLEGAKYRECNLTGTQFFGALLNFADFFNSELRGTMFDHAIINLPEVRLGGMAESINMGEIYGISVAGADMTAVDYLGNPYEMNLTFGTLDTKLCSQLEFGREKYYMKVHEIRSLKKKGEFKQAAEMDDDLRKNGFVDWFPYQYTDLARGSAYHDFLDRLELHGWPYR